MKKNALLIILSGALLFGSCDYLRSHRLFSKKSDAILDMTVTEPETIVEDTTTFYPDEIQPVVTPQFSDSKYFMIVGSFQNQNLAQLYSEKIEQMGYQSEIIEASNGFYRVTAKSYNNFRQGVNEIDDFRNSITPGAWLHVRR